MQGECHCLCKLLYSTTFNYIGSYKHTIIAIPNFLLGIKDIVQTTNDIIQPIQNKQPVHPWESRC